MASITFDPQFREWMRNDVIVENFISLSTDGYGARVYGDPFVVKGRLEQDTKIVKDRQGREVASDMQAYLDPLDSSGQSYVIDTTDRLTFPSGYVNSSIVNVLKHNGEDGETMFYEVLL